MNLNFFLQIVYRCDCLADPIASCFAKKTYSLKDICDTINEIDGEIIYCVKCGKDDKDIVLSCCRHMLLTIFTLTEYDSVFLLQTINCSKCITKYLRENYFIFKHVIFKE